MLAGNARVAQRCHRAMPRRGGVVAVGLNELEHLARLRRLEPEEHGAMLREGPAKRQSLRSIYGH